jgi:ABC-type proline/glycine betaine transport system substrate-binding protein
LRSDVDPQRNHEGIKKQYDIKKGEFYKIGHGNEIGNDVREEVKAYEQGGKELRKVDPSTK